MTYLSITKRGIQNGLHISLELAKAIIPVYILISVLEKSGMLEIIAKWCTPFMKLLGLPGEASLILVIGNSLNLYSALGGIQAMDLTFKQINIIAMALLISHGLFVENAVLKKTGVQALKLTFFRLAISMLVGLVINLVWWGA